VALRVAQLTGVKPADVRAAGKHPHIVCARSFFCFWAVRELGKTMAGLARNLGLSIPAISKSVVRGLQIAELRGFQLIKSWLALISESLIYQKKIGHVAKKGKKLSAEKQDGKNYACKKM